MTIKVLVVDDSAIVRQTLAKELARDREIEVIGSAPDPYVARDIIVRSKPDVVTLDIEMPRMDGLSFLRKIMKYHPIPVIIVSSLAQKGSELALEALRSGAVEVLCKPGTAYSVGDMSIELAEKIKAAAKADLSKVLKTIPEPSHDGPRPLSKTTAKIVLIGASTGGVQTLEYMLQQFPVDAPGTLIVQHMPAGFTKSFAERLNSMCRVEVVEAQSGEVVSQGRVLVAPGNHHMVVKRSGAQYYVEINQGPLVNRHRPSVDVLYMSAASSVGPNGIGVILTGMGNDGAKGMKKMRDAGAINFAQDEDSCIVYGMPKAAVEIGAVNQVVALDRMVGAIVEQVGAHP